MSRKQKIQLCPVPPKACHSKGQTIHCSTAVGYSELMIGSQCAGLGVVFLTCQLCVSQDEFTPHQREQFYSASGPNFDDTSKKTSVFRRCLTIIDCGHPFGTNKFESTVQSSISFIKSALSSASRFFFGCHGEGASSPWIVSLGLLRVT